MEQNADDEMEMPTRGERHLKDLFHRINNACIRKFLLNFEPESLRLPYYLMANAADLQCKIGALDVSATTHAIDNALVDFIAVHLKPQVYEAMVDLHLELGEEYVMLFTRNVHLRGSVTHLEYEVSASRDG